MFKIFKSPLFWFVTCLIAIALLAFFGPEEKSLGSNVRIVYLHGAWVLTAEIAFLAAGLAGLVGLLGLLGLPLLAGARADKFNRWSRALGWTGILFWVTYLPLSLWAMQANWSGLFLAEPRFRLALTFAVVGLLLQFGLWLIHKPWLTSSANLAFIIALRLAFASAEYIMHPPPSPIFSSGLVNIQVFFIGLNLLTLFAAYLLTRTFIRFNESAIQRIN